MTNYKVKEKNLDVVIGTGAEIQRLYNTYLETSPLFGFHPVTTCKQNLDSFGTYGIVFDLRTKQYYVVGCGVVLDWVRQGELIPKEDKPSALDQDTKKDSLSESTKMRLKAIYDNSTCNTEEEITVEEIQESFETSPRYIIEYLVDIVEALEN